MTTRTQTPPKSPLRWLALLLWVLVAALHLTMFVFDLVRNYSRILVECQGALGLYGGCDQLAISAAEVVALSSWGLTLPHYTIYMLAWVCSRNSST